MSLAIDGGPEKSKAKGQQKDQKNLRRTCIDFKKQFIEIHFELYPFRYLIRLYNYRNLTTYEQQKRMRTDVQRLAFRSTYEKCITKELERYMKDVGI